MPWRQEVVKCESKKLVTHIQRMAKKHRSKRSGRSSTMSPAPFKLLHPAKIRGQNHIREFCKKFHSMRLIYALKFPIGMVAQQNCVGCAPCCPGIVLGNIVNFFANVTYVSTDFPAVILHLVVFGFSIAVLIFASGKYVINGTRMDSHLILITLIVQQLLLKCGATGRQNFCCVCPVLNRVFCGHINIDIDLARVAESVRDVHWRPNSFPSANYFIPPIVSANGHGSALLLLVWYHFATGMEVDDEDVMRSDGSRVAKVISSTAVGRCGRPAARNGACAILTNSINTLGFPIWHGGEGCKPSDGGDGHGGDDGSGGGDGSPSAGSGGAKVARLHSLTSMVLTKIESYIRKLARQHTSEELDRRTKAIVSRYGYFNLLREPSLGQAHCDYIFLDKFFSQFQSPEGAQQPRSSRNKPTVRAWEKAFVHPQRINIELPACQHEQPAQITTNAMQSWMDAFTVAPRLAALEGGGAAVPLHDTTQQEERQEEREEEEEEEVVIPMILTPAVGYTHLRMDQHTHDVTYGAAIRARASEDDSDSEVAQEIEVTSRLHNPDADRIRARNNWANRY